jgi:DNA-binding GntR family transcriptional regulator
MIARLTSPIRAVGLPHPGTSAAIVTRRSSNLTAEGEPMSTRKPVRGQVRAKATSRDRNLEKVVSRVVATLEEDIVLGYLHPRVRLVEDDLRDRFGLKRHVVRQVLLELERMGLVERRKNVGAIVKSHTEDEVMNLYAVREILETSAAERIPLPAAREHLEQLEAIQHHHDAATAQGDLRAVFHANVAFHRAVFAATGNPELTALINSFAQRTNVIRTSSTVYPDHLEFVRKEHWEIIEALRAGDRGHLVELFRHHLVPARDNYIKRYQALARNREGPSRMRAA